MYRFLTDKEIKENKCRDCTDLERVRTYLNEERDLACPYKKCPYFGEWRKMKVWMSKINVYNVPR